MNIHWQLGIISFILWSAFSTWYYLNYIKEFPEKEKIEEVLPGAENEEIKEPVSINNTQPEEVVSDTTYRVFMFALNSINPQNAGAFNQFVDSIKPYQADLTFRIVGYTCDLGTEAYNLELGRKRAAFIRSELNEPDAFIESKGESDPAFPNTSEGNRQKNRRVKIQINSNK